MEKEELFFFLHFNRKVKYLFLRETVLSYKIKSERFQDIWEQKVFEEKQKAKNLMDQDKAISYWQLIGTLCSNKT